MAFKEVSTPTTSNYWPKKASERKTGDSIIGKYTGTRDINTPNGQETYYILNNSDGQTLVRASAGLKRTMEAVPEGSHIKIVFQGKQTGKNGRQYNAFSVYIDDGEDSSEKVDFDGLDF